MCLSWKTVLTDIIIECVLCFYFYRKHQQVNFFCVPWDLWYFIHSLRWIFLLNIWYWFMSHSHDNNHFNKNNKWNKKKKRLNIYIFDIWTMHLYVTFPWLNILSLFRNVFVKIFYIEIDETDILLYLVRCKMKVIKLQRWRPYETLYIAFFSP